MRVISRSRALQLEARTVTDRNGSTLLLLMVDGVMHCFTEVASRSAARRLGYAPTASVPRSIDTKGILMRAWNNGHAGTQ